MRDKKHGGADGI